MTQQVQQRKNHETDVVIIGAGPVGLFAIFECGMLKMRCHVVDALEFVGGQCTALYPEKMIYDVAGFPGIEAAGLIEQLEKQAEPFKPHYHLGQQVVGVKKEGAGFVVTTNTGTTITAKAILIAAGCGAFGPNRPPLDGLEQYEKTGAVVYLVSKKEQYRGKRVVIAGGGDSAIDWALGLQGIASEIYLVHRRPKFRAAPETVDRVMQLVEQKKIDLVVPYQLDGLEGQNGALTGVVVSDLDGNKKTLPADILMPFYGLAMELGPIAEWGLNLDQNRIAVNPATLETNVEGIYAIGDINHYEGKLKLIVCGFSEAAMAAHAIYPRIHPEQALHFEYSTSKGVPGA